MQQLFAICGGPLPTTIWVLFAGLPGVGKSTLADALSTRLDAAVLNKDTVRAALFPGLMTDYTAEQDQVCIGAMLDAAVYLTARARVMYVFFDGRTFSTHEQIEQIVRAAERVGALWRIVHVTCADAVAAERLATTAAPHPAGNRDAALYRAIKNRFQPIAHPHLQVDTTAGMHAPLEAVEAYLRTSAPGAAR